MLKMYQAQVGSGSSPDYWDQNWEREETARVLADERIAANDPVHDVLCEKLRPERLFLEGGCGQAQWVKYFANRGYRAVGVDFAARTIERIQRAAPELDVRVGDILQLPFADGEVHSYYSGGVVEHRELGPDPALREARRVLARDGWFLCSVPDESWLRRGLFARARTERADLEPRLLVRRVDETREEPPPPGMAFFQYAFTEAEFTARLARAGFVVERTFGYALVWGLMEIPGFQALYQRSFSAARQLRDRLRPPPDGGDSDGGAVVAANGAGGAGAGWLRRALVKEDRTLPIIGPLLELACNYGANMRMFVARPA